MMLLVKIKKDCYVGCGPLSKTDYRITHCASCITHALYGKGHMHIAPISTANFWILTVIYTFTSLWKHWALRLLIWYMSDIKCSLFKEAFCYPRPQLLTKLCQISVPFKSQKHHELSFFKWLDYFLFPWVNVNWAFWRTKWESIFQFR